MKKLIVIWRWLKWRRIKAQSIPRNTTYGEFDIDEIIDFDHRPYIDHYANHK